MTSAGVLVGGVVAMATARLIANLLFEVRPTDVTTFAGVAVLLLAVAIVASWMPAQRAAKVDPVMALRSD